MNRIILSVFASAAILCATPAAFSASDTVVTRGVAPLVVPAASGLHYKSTDRDGAMMFEGHVMISGTYDYELGEDADSTSLEIVFDRDTRARLPHFKDHDSPDRVSFSNAAGFAVAAKLAKGTKHAHGKTAVWADKFQAGIECDVAFYSAHFVSLAQPLQKVASKDQDEEGC